ncbi:alpha/beta hydrolase [Gallaecimonas sp. GXIMD4217]|uniref:alpha/beta fold hydrolase n=1 Tax=Gallaecimonas sp. GXIMD4217 TaxID=3131927 RepID=UPI00311B39D7
MADKDILYLHSSMSDGRQWLALHRDWPGILQDLLGYGGAHAMPEQGQFRLADEVAQFELPGPVHVCGHSYGGATALHLAASRPELVRSLCLYEPVAFSVLAKGSPERDEVELLASRMQRLSAHDGAAAFVNYWNGSDVFSAMPPRLQDRLSRQAFAVIRNFESLINEPTDPAVIQVPVRLIVGRRSPASSRAVVAELARRLPQAEVVEVDAGHMGPVQAPEQVLPHFADFLAEVTGR